MCTCQIRWIDDHGNPTDDTNPAIGRARTIDHYSVIDGRKIHFNASTWYYICAEHAKRLNDPGMDIWEYQSL